MPVISELTWGGRDFDREFFEREVEDFLPDRIFDAHAHLCRFADVGEAMRKPWEGVCPPEFSLARYGEEIRWLHGDRPTGGLFVGIVPNDNCEASNGYVAGEVRREAGARAHFLVRPSDDPDWVRQEVRRLGMCGLKPFHSFVREPIAATMEAELPEYLPEPLMRLAHEEGWSVTVHLVKRRGPADPGNLHWIRRYCENFPDARLMLCHTVRGWNPSHVFEGLPRLRGLPNLWVCTDLNSSALAIEAALRILGPERIVYGTDFWWSHIRGLCTYAGDGFLWLYEGNYDWERNLIGRGPTLAGLEHLRAVKWACWSVGLSDRQVEDYFYGNAHRLFGMEG
ncbi:MAG: amidohydrolase family protein [Planctomycetota bacterium]